MKNWFIICVLAVTMAAASAHRLKVEWQPNGAAPIKIGLVTEADNTPPADPGLDGATSCDHVLLSRKLKYGESDQNVLDIASADATDGTPRPVLLFVAGDSFAIGGEQADATAQLLEQAMCFAARNGMVAASMSYRLAPAAPWPAGARDVAAAISWIHQNIDLFRGDAREIVVIGYATGAFHVASFLAHKELQEADSDIAGAVLVSGIYRSGSDAADSERSYLGADARKYNDRSAFPGILEVEVPIVLAWSAADPPRLVTQGETLKAQLCNAGHCPRTALLTKPDSPASVFDLDGSGGSLAERTKQLLRQIETRGLP
jgi:acetyl esterase/lipase